MCRKGGLYPERTHTFRIKLNLSIAWGGGSFEFNQSIWGFNKMQSVSSGVDYSQSVDSRRSIKFNQINSSEGQLIAMKYHHLKTTGYNRWSNVK